MRETVTVSLPQPVKRELDRIAAREGLSRSDVVRASLEEYFFARRFRALRDCVGISGRARDGAASDAAGQR